MRCVGYIGAWIAGGWVALPRPRVPKFSKTNRPDSPYLCGPGFILFLRFRFRFIFLCLSLYFISGCFCPALYLLYIRAMPPALHPLDTAELAPYMSIECRTATAAARTTTVLRLWCRHRIRTRPYISENVLNSRCAVHPGSQPHRDQAEGSLPRDSRDERSGTGLNKHMDA